MFGFGAGLDGPLEIGVEADGDDLGWGGSEQGSAASALLEFFDVVALLGYPVPSYQAKRLVAR